MALQEADAPSTGRDLKGIVEEIYTQGKMGQWYFVTSYDNPATARTTAHTLRGRYKLLDIRADEGTILARIKEAE